MILQLLMPTASCLITAVWSLPHKCIDVIDDFATTDANLVSPFSFITRRMLKINKILIKKKKKMTMDR